MNEYSDKHITPLRHILAIDPGVHALGWAVLKDGLFCCGLQPLQSAGEALAQVGAMGAAKILERVGIPKTLVIERPVLRSRAPARKEDVLRVAEVAAGIVGYAYAFKISKIHAPTPGDWKGSVPKGVHHARLIPRLPPEVRGEKNFQLALACKIRGHNTIDAVGLLWWYLQTQDDSK